MHPGINLDIINVRILNTHDIGKGRAHLFLYGNTSYVGENMKLDNKNYESKRKCIINNKEENNLVYKEVNEYTLDNIKKTKITKKNECCVSVYYKLIDYYCEKELFKFFNYIQTYGTNKNNVKKNIMLIKIKRLGLASILTGFLIAIPMLLVKGSSSPLLVYILFGISILMMFYILVKVVKNIFLVAKKGKFFDK